MAGVALSLSAFAFWSVPEKARQSSSLNHASSSTLSPYLPPSRPCDFLSSSPLAVLVLLGLAQSSTDSTNRPLARPYFAVDLDPRLVIGQQIAFSRFRVPLPLPRNLSLRRLHSGYHQVGGRSPYSVPQPPSSGPKDLGLWRRQEAAITGPRQPYHIVYCYNNQLTHSLP
ncbi:hypothetical protein AUEXF2481DRAFT_620695 [Aureobasidium subglaciale EXF-2481]|uniref:Uncharacterized protein n=1 Tax=Aureobasidium subglaciale (strain EXF-2481) TaxID=1043005 RepID=A0A074ZE30_AURSE|nr:uncharacterized protein AUEXF2481DRAFT_620695 [Aureobasidium subglaciale EXF-2481]KEQ96916.1 hypothetical protein AUEXF2481DRAFT_620695 [Aureobasidium subglaciale EXF-2481]